MRLCTQAACQIQSLLTTKPMFRAPLLLPAAANHPNRLHQLLEEAGVTVPELHHRGVLTFVFDDQPVPWEVHGELNSQLSAC